MMSCTNSARDGQPIASPERGHAFAVYEPIRWCGFYEDEDDQRWLIFKAADGVRREILATAALAASMFDWGTATPVRRDALHAWAADPDTGWPSLHPERV